LTPPSTPARRPTSCSTSIGSGFARRASRRTTSSREHAGLPRPLEAEAAAEGREKREELVAAARRDIDIETRRALERIRKEVADLTVLATEKLTRKTLEPEDQQRLIEEALAEVDFSALAANGGDSD
jgi:hypothetical protein